MLSQELRPNAWSEMAGQQENIKILKAIIKNPENSPKCLIFCGQFGSGKCVDENTRVLSSLGYIKIRDMFENPEFDAEGFYDISDKDVKVYGGVPASHFYYGGLKETVHISALRFDLTGTPNHRVLAMTEHGVDWVYLADIKEGDYICMDITNNTELPFNNSVLELPNFHYNSNEFLKGYFVGAILGDGEVPSENSKSNRVLFMGTLDDCTNIASMFSIPCNMRKSERSRDLYTLEIYDKELKQVLVDFGMCGNSENRRIPEPVFRSNKEFISGVLSGLIDTDGSCGTGIDFTSISENLARGFRDLMNLFGIFPRLTIRRIPDNLYVNGNVHNHCKYRVNVDVCDYGKLVGVIRLHEGYKMQKVLSIAESLKDTSKRDNSTLDIPRTSFTESEIERLYQECKNAHARRFGTSWKKYMAENSRPFHVRNNCCLKYRTFTVQSWNRLKSEYNTLSDGKGSFVSVIDDYISKYRFFRVSKVERSKSVVYDLTVPDTHSFVANGLINHNTTSARIMARELNNIKDPKYDLLSSPFYYEFDSTVIGNIEEIRRLRDMFTVNYGDYWRVIVLDEVHAVSNAAQTALLKILEEAEGRNLFIMCTTHVHKVLPTIRSRSLELKFDVVPPDEIIKNLERVSTERDIVLSDEVKLLIADRSGGHMRNAHMLLDKFCLLGEEDFKDSIHSAISLYCEFFNAVHENNSGGILDSLNALMNIPKDDLQNDFNAVMTESMRGLCGFPVRHRAIQDMLQVWGKDFQAVVACYMAPWIKNAFVDMPYFEATMLNMYLVLRGQLAKVQAPASNMGNTPNNLNNRYMRR